MITITILDDSFLVHEVNEETREAVNVSDQYILTPLRLDDGTTVVDGFHIGCRLESEDGE